VLCGNFTSPSGLAHTGARAHAANARARAFAAPPPPPRRAAKRSELTALFETLAGCLKQFPTLREHAHFVIVPGPDDATLGCGHVLPRPQMPQTIMAPLLATLKHCHLGSNPMRLILCGQEARESPRRPRRPPADGAPRPRGRR
jgi:hypothetical protein